MSEAPERPIQSITDQKTGYRISDKPDRILYKPDRISDKAGRLSDNQADYQTTREIIRHTK